MTDAQTNTQTTGQTPTNRREELLDRAGELMAAKGYDGTSMRDIASAVGMLPGSLYYHFDSKESLFLALHQRVVAVMEARVRAALTEADQAGLGPWDRLEAAATAHRLEASAVFPEIFTFFNAISALSSVCCSMESAI